MDSQRDSSNKAVSAKETTSLNSTTKSITNSNHNPEIKFEELKTNSTEQLKPFRCLINEDRLNQLRKKVEDAIRDKKTFTIKGGFQTVRNALIQRGWVEKIEIKNHLKNVQLIQIPPTMDEVCNNLPPKQEWETIAAHTAKCEKMIISRLLQTHEVDFYWNLRRDASDWQQRLCKNKIVNRFARSLFTSKEGLCLLLQQMHWYTEPGVANMRFPRCYTINFSDQCTSFVQDFRLTACISLLKWFCQKMQKEGQYSLCTASGKVNTNIIQFAIDRCNEYVAVQKHVDIDKDFQKIWDHEWEEFLTQFELVIHSNEKLKNDEFYAMITLESTAKIAIKNMTPYWPQIELDGIRNIWIMKPGNKCRGRDITLIKDVNDVVRVINHKLKYVVQKYIERPLLIYKTKFDIRQWFLVTSVQPLTVWIYRDCYLRFSSQKFCLEDLHESVHLTNHAVQHKYSNQDRDKSLPDDNMWDNHTFKAYLRQIGQAEKWYKTIYPGIKECIIAAMLASQETMDRRPNTFELYGADFMILENFTPWLIEINSCPAMGPTTSVTARMCPQCFEDVVKVVVDRRRDPKADTGLFEVLYKQTLPQTPAYLGMTLSVRGRKIFKKRSAGKREKAEQKREHHHDMKRQNSHTKIKISKQAASDIYRNYSGPIIENMFEDFYKSDNIEEGGLHITPSPPSRPPNTAPELIRRQTLSTMDESIKIVTQKVPILKNRSVSSNNPNIFLDRNISSRDGSLKTRKNTHTRNNQKYKNISQNSSQNRPLSLYDKWKHSVEQKPIKIHQTSWEQDTASILKNKSDPKSIINHPCYLSSITKILPEIENKSSENIQCQSLFTVGLGYKNKCYKNVIKENILLPMGK